jgi:putative hydrolase of the HAD superfamily
MTKVILFDLDGVLTLPEEMFSVLYAGSRGYEVAPFTNFFQDEWVDFVIGKKDLKRHIRENPDFWRWDKSPEELLQFWFESENIKNDLLLKLIYKLRNDGVKCYVATEQEQYRTDYIKNVMFAGEFDGTFSTAEIGYRKNDPRFYEVIVSTLAVPKEDIIFFDDSESKISVAKDVGIDAYLYKSVRQVEDTLTGSGS